VALAAGVNVIDVLASDGDARPALTAVRVKRIITVSVPDVRGLSPDDARKQLTAAGLKVDTQQTGGGLFDQLLGNSPRVCDTSPAAGDEVDAGATVTVTASRRC
jgi:beta-lactam-binding protein with PASTA domain